MTDKNFDPLWSDDQSVDPIGGPGDAVDPAGTTDPLLRRVAEINPVSTTAYSDWAAYETAMAACDAIIQRDQRGPTIRERLISLRPASTFWLALATCAAIIAIPVVALLASTPSELTGDDGGPAGRQVPSQGPNDSTIGAPPTTAGQSPIPPNDDAVLGEAYTADGAEGDDTAMLATSQPSDDDNETSENNDAEDDSTSDNDHGATNSDGDDDNGSDGDKPDDDQDQPAPPPACGVVSIETELLDLTGDWKSINDQMASGGRYITWRGLETGKHADKPQDVLNIQFAIEKPGLYRFTWSMRQPEGARTAHADESWINFPDANRFGPVAGGNYNRFIRVEGRAADEFDFSATGYWNGAETDIGVMFNKPGYYTMQLGGRAHEHQIDRVLLHHRSIKQADAVVSPCATQPVPRSVPAANNSDFDRSEDLVALHFDFAPGLEDAHAAAAARELVTRYRLNALVVSGTHGLNGDQYKPGSEKAMNAIWGQDGWINADSDRSAAVGKIAFHWRKTLEAGGDIWVAEGGPSDVTAAVVRRLNKILPAVDTSKRIHVVHAGGWDQRQTTPAELTFIQEASNFITVDDGNSGDNDTADLNMRSDSFARVALDGWHGPAWEAAFEQLPGENRVDFSNTVAVLHVLGIDRSEVATVNDFAEQIVR